MTHPLRPSRLGIVIGILLGSFGCSPDLQEVAGPTIPLPNLTGTVVRGEIPVEGWKVKLVDVRTDSTILDDRTDTRGRYRFAEVEGGRWEIKVSSSLSGDFASVSYPVELLTAETSFEIPPIDLALHGLYLSAPAAEERKALPTFTEPIEFRWSASSIAGARAQVRLYDASGRSIWYSDKTTAAQAFWNGLGNQGDSRGRPAPAGAYRWRLRLEAEGSPMERNTEYRNLVLEERP